MRIHTLIQIVQAVLFAGVGLYGVLAQRPSVIVLSLGLLVGLATINILEPEGGTTMRRSLAGYGLGSLVAVAGLLLIYAGR